MNSLRIILLGLVSAVGYGLLHDQVTVRISLEYFTIGHPPLVPTEDPTLLALAWGVVATWWVGLPLGGLLASRGTIWLQPWLARSIAPERHVRFLVALWAHSASYAVGIVGGIVCAILVRLGRERARLAVA